MTARHWARFGAVALFGASLCGCNSLPLPGPLHYGPCGPNRHTEAYPLAKDPRHAYGCKSDDDGFLEGPGQGDRPRN